MFDNTSSKKCRAKKRQLKKVVSKLEALEPGEAYHVSWGFAKISKIVQLQDIVALIDKEKVGTYDVHVCQSFGLQL